ncbi:hypothetical protein Fmac_020613 [Flemingia macrophylla]|uniref:DUF4408 domain-containing protein n=1 Tax=Flemingia macrophylla TaxID=520843 RepID=A0ABD1LUQ7_9FABA
MNEASVYAAMASWLTPSCLFLFINLIIGTIAITSRFTKKQNQNQLIRSPSLLERVTSFNFRHHKHEQTPTTPHSVVDSVQNPDLSKLGRIPSMLNRVRSFNLGFTKHEIEEPVEPVQNLDRTPSLLDRIRSFNILSFHETEIDQTVEPAQHQLSRAPSLLDRVRSLNLGFGKAEVKESDEVAQPFERSESVKESPDAEEMVDAKADDFINRFRQQLRLQRLDSILRYRDMLKRN